MQEEIKVTSIKMPFWNMVWFIIKWTLASIVALAILALLFVVVITIIAIVMGESVDIGHTVNHYSSQFHSHYHSN